jgi:hypothetical protein
MGIKTNVVNSSKKSKKRKKFKLNKLIGVSLISLTSGLWFGIGYNIIDHADSAWFQAKDPAPSTKVATATSDN